MPDPSAAGRPELLHRGHVVHELIDGDLGALPKARCFVVTERPSGQPRHTAAATSRDRDREAVCHGMRQAVKRVPPEVLVLPLLGLGILPIGSVGIVIGEVHGYLLELTTERGFHVERQRPLMKAYTTRTQYLPPSDRSLTPSSPRDEDRLRGNQRVHPDDAGLAFENVERNRQDHDGCQPGGSQWRQPRRYPPVASSTAPHLGAPARRPKVWNRCRPYFPPNLRPSVTGTNWVADPSVLTLM
jgi:hypothetical protein